LDILFQMYRYIICTTRIIKLVNKRLSDNIPTYFDSFHSNPILFLDKNGFLIRGTRNACGLREVLIAWLATVLLLTGPSISMCHTCFESRDIASRSHQTYPQWIVRKQKICLKNIQHSRWTQNFLVFIKCY